MPLAVDMESSAVQIDVLSAEAAHMQALIELGATHYKPGHPALTIEFLRWFYLENPAGAATLVVAQEEGVWIGLIAMIPVGLVRAGVHQPASFAVHVLSHPAHRGKNLFVKMIRAAKAYLQQHGIWLLGHPNAAAMPGWRRQKMHFCAPLRPRLAKWVLPWSGLTSRTVTSAAELQALPDDWWAKIHARADVQVRVDPLFLSWRYLQAPHKRYRVETVWRGDRCLGWRVSRSFKGPLALLVDHGAALNDLPSVVGSVRRPTLVMHADGGLTSSQIALASWPLPRRREMPFFASTWGDEPGVDMTGITLAASDF